MNSTILQEGVGFRSLSNGMKLPCIGMGTFGSDRYGAQEIAGAVRDGIDIGYRLIDCAACYGNEPEIGVVFEEAISTGKVKREDLTIISKVWNDMHGRGDVMIACMQSLKDLRLDYLDIYLVHWPFANYHAPGCDGDSRNPDSKPFNVEDFMICWRQCERLVDLGLVKAIGMSNMTIAKLEAVLPLCRIKPVVIEMELHPCFQQVELFNYCVERNIQPIGYCPLGSPNRPDRDKAEGDIVDMQTPEVLQVAQRHNVHPALVCLKWAVQRGQIPIPFSVNRKNYLSNLQCVTEDPLTKEEMELLAGADCNNRLIKGQVFLWKEAKGWEDLWDLDGSIVS